MKTAKGEQIMFLIGAFLLVMLMVLIFSKHLQDQSAARERHRNAVTLTERFWEDHNGR